MLRLRAIRSAFSGVSGPANSYQDQQRKGRPTQRRL